MLRMRGAAPHHSRVWASRDWGESSEGLPAFGVVSMYPPSAWRGPWGGMRGSCTHTGVTEASSTTLSWVVIEDNGHGTPGGSD